jgi:pyruvate dehydrogenase E1 component
LLASSIPACQVYDPAFAYELSIVVQDGIRRMYLHDEDVFYYLTIYNENYDQPPQPDDVRQGVIDGLYRWAEAEGGHERRATILFSGPAHQAARAAADELSERWGVSTELWSATSYKRLREEALEVERWNRLNPTEEQRRPLVTRLLAQAPGPVVAVSDYVRAVPEQIARFVPRSFVALGTDGYGRSDTRDRLRRFFETDTPNVVVTVLEQLAQVGEIERSVVAEAVGHYDLDPTSAPPWER